MLKFLCKSFQRKKGKERKKRNKKDSLCTLPSKQWNQDQVHYSINFTLQTDEVNEWHSALKRVTTTFSSKEHAKKKP